jgi:hypothetical protein
MLMAAGFSSKSYKELVLSDNPSAFWLLNDNTGNIAADSSINGLSGTYTGGYTLGAAPPPNAPGAVLLDGSSGYVDCGAPAQLNFTAAWTLEAWAFNVANPAGSCLISEQYAGGGNVLFRLGFGDAIGAAASTLSGGFYTGSSWQAVVGPTLSLNTWHHVAVSWDGTSLRLYVDGVTVATATPSSAPVAGVNRIYVGRRWDTSASPYYNGRIAAASIYGSALAEARISAHYNAGK